MVANLIYIWKFHSEHIKKTSSTVRTEEHIQSNKAVLQHIFPSHNLQKYSEVE